MITFILMSLLTVGCDTSSLDQNVDEMNPSSMFYEAAHTDSFTCSDCRILECRMINNPYAFSKEYKMVVLMNRKIAYAGPYVKYPKLLVPSGDSTFNIALYVERDGKYATFVRGKSEDYIRILSEERVNEQLLNITFLPEQQDGFIYFLTNKDARHSSGNSYIGHID